MQFEKGQKFYKGKKTIRIVEVLKKTCIVEPIERGATVDTPRTGPQQIMRMSTLEGWDRLVELKEVRKRTKENSELGPDQHHLHPDTGGP